MQIYRGPDLDCTRDAIADARQVDSLITAAFEWQRSEVQTNFIAPHFHLGHINQEFNPSIVISFQLPGNSHVTLKVFDVNGREVATLMAAGNHVVTFAQRETRTGLYFYGITAGQVSQSHKAVLVK